MEETHNALSQYTETSYTHIISENAAQQKDSEIICCFSSALTDIGNAILVIQLQYDYISCISCRASILREGVGR